MAETTQWWMGPMLGFDVETTDSNPEEARIVQFALALVNATERSVDARAELVNPGVPIPPESTAIHGITDEMVADAMTSDEAMAIIATAAWAAIEGGYPIVIFQARFDTTVADRECRRAGLKSPFADPRLRVIDPRQLDLYLWRYRPSFPAKYKRPDGTYDKVRAAADGVPSSRTLAGCCDVYNAKLENAHDAAHDAIAAARLAYRIGQSGAVMLERPYDEVQAQKAEWEFVRGSVDQLHALQVSFAARDAARFEEFLHKQGDTDAVIDRQWPLIPFGERDPGATAYEAIRRERAREELRAAEAQETLVEHAATSPVLQRASDLLTPEALEQAQANLFSTERTPAKDRT